MKKEEALEKVHKGTIIVYEGANSEICIGEVQTISKYGTVGVYDIVDGKVGAGGEYHRSPEEYFIYEIEDTDYYLKNQEKYLHRTPTKEEFFWYKLCMQTCELRDEYRELYEKLQYAEINNELLEEISDEITDNNVGTVDTVNIQHRRLYKEGFKEGFRNALKYIHNIWK